MRAKRGRRRVSVPRVRNHSVATASSTAQALQYAWNQARPIQNRPSPFMSERGASGAPP